MSSTINIDDIGPVIRTDEEDQLAARHIRRLVDDADDRALLLDALGLEAS